MDVLQSSYANPSPDSSPLRLSLPAKSSAPRVDDDGAMLASFAVTQPLDPTQYMVRFNPSFDQMWAPITGPAHPSGIAHGYRNHQLGSVEGASVESFAFDQQYNTYHKHGYATDPSGNNFVGDLDALQKIGGRKKRKAENQADDVDPGSDDWIRMNRKSPWATGSENEEIFDRGLTEEQKKYAEEHKKKKEGNNNGGAKTSAAIVDKTAFHGKEERDYQGRSWISPPKEVKACNDHCYIPKRSIHTFKACNDQKGVSAIRFFPNYGHLLLSAGMDSKVKIWDVHNSRQCMRTYMGHSEAVKDICFSNNGSKFLSGSYDKNIKYWDTETGKVISTFSTGKIPFAVKLNPDEDKQKVVMAGMSDKKIVQWDVNSGKMTQVYDQHLGAVNTITFVDSNRRFITSSDDKSLRVWEFGIPVVIKSISEPHMHSMPAVSVHPDSNWLAAQSMDNQIVVYSTGERFQENKKKRFSGHAVAGYGCQVNFSPDGRFLVSGDGEGNCWFWDWKKCKVLKKLRNCHQGVCIGVEWHPLEQSMVATCGWDGLIKYWD